MLAKLKHEGNARVIHKEPLLKADLGKLYSSFDMETPSGLQNKVFVDFMMYFCNKGRENLRELKKSDFSIDENENYIAMRDMATKNYRGDIQDGDSQGGRIYKIGGKFCPHASFLKYLSLLNENCDAFFQRPKRFLQSEGNHPVWYDNAPLSKNTLGDKMKTLSAETNLSRIYTNHCLRATSIILLDGFEARHIMTISVHKSETSIRSYAGTGNEQKEKMARTIAGALSGGDQQEQPLANVQSSSTGKFHQDMTVKLGETSGENFDVDGMDLLEPTSSQETYLLRDVQNLLPTSPTLKLLPTSPTLNVPTHTAAGAPVYYLPHSTVHIHHY